MGGDGCGSAGDHAHRAADPRRGGFADPRDWNATHDVLNPNDDPEQRWADAALANGYFTQHLAEDHNGMDH